MRERDRRRGYATPENKVLMEAIVGRSAPRGEWSWAREHGGYARLQAQGVQLIVRWDEASYRAEKFNVRSTILNEWVASSPSVAAVIAAAEAYIVTEADRGPE